MLLNTRQVVYWLSRDQYKQQRLSRPQHRSESKSKFVLLFLLHRKKICSAPPFNFSLFISCFSLRFRSVLLNYTFKSLSSAEKKKKVPVPIRWSWPPCVSFPDGPSAAEVCGNNHPPTVCSLAASPALCMGLFMFLSANNNLRERSSPSLGMRQSEAACRRWVRNRGHRQEGPLARTTTQHTQR